MLKSLHKTTLGAWLVHVLLISAWVLGIPAFVLPVMLIISGHNVIGTIILVVFCSQWVLHLKPWPEFRRSIRDLTPGNWYKECRLILVDEKDMKPERSMICYHPHGALCAGFSWCGCHHPEFSEGRHGDFTWLIADILTKMPFFKLVTKWMGNIQSAAKENVLKLMQTGKNIAIIPGGFQDATLMERGVDRIFLKNRKGFIKYALVHGYRVHPCYVFGERDTYHTFLPMLKLRLRLNDHGLPGALFFGEWWCPILPLSSTRIVTVIGKGLDFPCLPIGGIKAEDIDKYHSLYVKALKDLFESHKVAAGFPNAQLEMR